MSPSAGDRIGPYEVLSLLGEGGMGQVFRARDTKLNRVVAIKTLQPAGAGDPDRVARFDREAQLLATLHHPNIAGIYGLEQAGGATYLALEFVDGRPLDALLRENGALSPSEALRIARQIADAIAAAHERGIIHRDLKPANVMVTAEGQVKVLDFGLGKALDDGHSGSGGSATANSPTTMIGATQAGLILGTAGYMSPEQAKGRAADRRSDVWSFGCVLFELLAGARAFDGEDITDTIAAIVRGEPNWKALPATTPPALRTLVERCLVKDRAERLADMSVVRYVLNEPNVLGESGRAAVPAPQPVGRPSRGHYAWMAIALLSAGAAAIFAFLDFSRPAAPTATAGAPARYTVVLPDGVEVANAGMVPLALSPDASMLAFAGERDGKIQLFVHRFSTGETTAFEGTDSARTPFFSTDGRWIGFFAKAKLKKITVGGTGLQEIAAASDARGGSWGPDDTIYYAPTNVSGLWMVPAAGGTPTALTKPDVAASEISHRNPYVLPGGKALLFLNWTGPGPAEHRIEYLSLADRTHQVVARGADGPMFAIQGRLVYSGHRDDLLTVPWEATRPSVGGAEPTTLPFLAHMENEGVAAYAAASNGTFAYVAGDVKRHLSRVVWVSRAGVTEPLTMPERDYTAAAISPDGTRAALQVIGDLDELWILDFRTKSFTPLVTTGGSSQAPVWTADSKYVVYRGTRQGFRNLFMKAADGSGGEIRLTTKAGVIETPTSASPDGKWILTNESGDSPVTVIARVSLEGDHAIEPLVSMQAPVLDGQMSPDGRWVAFDCLVTGRSEIWVKPTAGSGPMRQVSHDGGASSRWSRDGRELYYLGANGMMVVSVSGETLGQPRLLVEGRYRPASNANSNYDVAGDGRFLHAQPAELPRALTRIEVILNGLAGHQ